MTRDILVQTIITIHSYSLHIRARKVVVSNKGEFVACIDRDPVPDVMSREDVTTCTKESVNRVTVCSYVVRDRHLINVGWYVYPGPSNTPNLTIQKF